MAESLPRVIYNWYIRYATRKKLTHAPVVIIAIKEIGVQMDQDQKTKSTGTTEEVEEVEAKDLSNEELEESTMDILDEIDDVLEENAQEFVAGFVQRGGE